MGHMPSPIPKPILAAQMKWDIYETFETCLAQGATNVRTKQRVRKGLKRLMPTAACYYRAVVGTRHESVKPARQWMKLAQFAETFLNEKIVVTLSRQLG